MCRSNVKMFNRFFDQNFNHFELYRLFFRYVTVYNLNLENLFDDTRGTIKDEVRNGRISMLWITTAGMNAYYRLVYRWRMIVFKCGNSKPKYTVLDLHRSWSLKWSKSKTTIVRIGGRFFIILKKKLLSVITVNLFRVESCRRVSYHSGWPLRNKFSVCHKGYSVHIAVSITNPYCK